MLGRTAGFPRFLSGYLVMLMMAGIAGCRSDSTVTPAPVSSPKHEVSILSTISCSVPTPPPKSTYLWLVLDRSESMRRECADYIEKFFLLPGFFAHIGKLVESKDLYFAISLIGPDEEFLTPTRISEIDERKIVFQLGSHIIGKSPTNEYEKGLKRVKDQMTVREVRRAVVILTDGTFSPGHEKKEREDILETLRSIRDIGGEVYVLLCSKTNKKFWEELSANGLLSAPPYQFSEGVKEVGEKLFPGGSPHSMGWFLGSPDFELRFPAVGVTALVSLAIIADDGDHFSITYPDTREQFGYFLLGHLIKNKNIYVGDYSFNLTKLPPMDCQGPKLKFTRQQNVDVGFYIVQSSPWSGYRFNVNVQISVNEWPGTVEFSPLESLLNPSCYTFSLNSSEIITTRLAQNKFAWKPSSESDRPRNLSASVSLQVTGDDTLLDCGTISLPVKFAPEPIKDRVMINPSPENIGIKEQSFPFRYVPQSSRPAIYLCSSKPPPLGNLSKIDLKCGTPYPDGQTMVCPTPVSRPEGYCVRAEFMEGPKDNPTREHPIVVSESGSGYASYTYTIRLYECLEKCEYERLYFQWPESASTVTQSITYTKRSGTWQRESSSR